MKKAVWFLLIFLLAGCSGVPSDKEIEQQIMGEFNDLGFMEVSNFKKTNGYRQSDNSYIVDVEYLVTFTKSLADIKQGLSEVSHTNPLLKLSLEAIAMGLYMQYGDFKEGFSTQQAKKVTFLKTEKGWVLADDKG